MPMPREAYSAMSSTTTPTPTTTTTSSDKEQKQQREDIEISTNSNKRQKSTTTTTPNASSCCCCCSLSHSWPFIDPTPSRYQFKENSGLLYGLDNELWTALGYLDPNDFLNTSKGKQVIIRKALNLLNLGWIATNTFPFRGPIGKKFDTAKQMHNIMSNNNNNNYQKALNSNNMIPPPSLTPKTIIVEDRKLGKDGECVLDIFTSAVVNPLENLKNVNNIKATIEKYGVAVIRSALPKLRLAARGGAADHVHEQQQQQQKPPKPKRQRRVIKIQHTTGNGIAGFCSNSNNGKSSASPSYYGDLGSSDVKTSNNDSNTILDDVEYWADVQARILRCFLHNNNNINNKHDHSVNEVLKKRKTIFLKYSEGAENWAHRDGSIDDDDVFPYQAMVMLSEPGKDFTGGEFYVASKRIISSSNKDSDGGDDGGGNSSNKNSVHHILRTYVEFYNQGDMVIFQANKAGGYDHGMLTVQKGSATRKCERSAIGMFQKA